MHNLLADKLYCYADIDIVFWHFCMRYVAFILMQNINKPWQKKPRKAGLMILAVVMLYKFGTILWHTYSLSKTLCLVSIGLDIPYST